MRSKILCALLVSLLVVPVLAYGAATITVGNVTAPVSGSATIDITVSGVPSPGVATIQGEITFDPKVLSIDTAKGENGLEALQGFDFYYPPQVDNTNGSILFLAGITGTTGATTGVILRLNVKAAGADGESSPVTLEMSVFRDTNDKDIDKQVYNGLFTISSDQLPTANFSYSPLHPVTEDEVNFYADDTEGSWTWHFGDGVTESAKQNPTHTYDEPGVYWVTLTVNRSNGLSATHSEEIRVGNAPPTASFSFSPSSPYPGQSVAFDASDSSDIDGSIVQYQWAFSDGSPVLYTTAKIVYHSFPAAGSYSVNLTVVDDQGTTGDLTKAVPVQEGGAGGENTPPTAAIGVEPKADEAKIYQIVHFDASGSKDTNGKIAAYQWDFESDGTYDATGKTAQHIYSTVGVYTVTLRVADDEGAFGFATVVISIQFVSPTADFTFDPATPSTEDVVSFDAADSLDEDGWIQFYAWDFDGDGIIDATGKFVNHKFTTPGQKPVILTVTDNDGATGTTTKSVFVRKNSAPKADFTFLPKDPTVTDTIQFTDTSKDDIGIAQWRWDFGDETTSDVQSPSHKYANVKTYSVKLTVTDTDGASSNITKDVTVSAPLNAPPVAAFTFSPALPQVGSAVSFSSDPSTDSDGTVTAWSWNFGDGATSQVRNPSHTFSSTGTYSVTLSVTDSDGAESAITKKQIQVAAAGAEVGIYSYPNPSVTQAAIVYYLPTGATEPVLRICNITGALVFEQALIVGESPYVWDLSSAGGMAQPNGLYLCAIVAKDANGRTIKSLIFKFLIAR